MIKYALICSAGHAFESWFRRGDDFEEQRACGALSCPYCGDASIDKQPMAPAVVTRRKRTRKVEANAPATNAAPTADPRHEAVATIRAFKQQVMSNADDVGRRFAEEARRMHFGEIPERAIVGEATREDAQGLLDEGIPFGILPTLPEDHN